MELQREQGPNKKQQQQISRHIDQSTNSINDVARDRNNTTFRTGPETNKELNHVASITSQIVSLQEEQVSNKTDHREQQRERVVIDHRSQSATNSILQTEQSNTTQHQQKAMRVNSHNSDRISEIPLLNDRTIPLDEGIHRPWLQQKKQEPPPAMLLLMNFGWNHPNQTFGIQQYRGMRSRELLDGIVNHPWFHPTGWEDLNTGKMPISNTTRYYIFLDAETCGEQNYPVYGSGLIENRDKEGGRGVIGEESRKVSLRFEEAVGSKLMQQAQHVTYVLFECGGWGPRRNFWKMRERFELQLPKERLAFISLSTTQGSVHARPWDQGLVPPACRKCVLSPEEEANIQNCNEESRRYLISYTGSIRSQTRRDLKDVSEHEDDMLIGGKYDALTEHFNSTGRFDKFELLGKRSSFAAASRGDNLFSYRFSEVMGCGAIPVVYADDWMLPFGGALINWTNEAVVRIPENKTNSTKAILSRISLADRCQMRQRALELYRTYIATGRGTIRGIIENFESAAAAAA